MTQADSVLSTPPTNMPIDTTRRRFLAVAAGASVASVGTLAGAAAMPAAVAGGSAAVDPIYAAIERHKQTAAVWDAAVDVRCNFDDLDMTKEQREQCDELNDAVEDAWMPCRQAGLDLINTEPTTLAGIIAAIQYIRIQMSDDGIYMPHHLILDTGGDAQDTMGWIDAFLGTIANTAAALGNAVLA
jgi:hypothetical protein